MFFDRHVPQQVDGELPVLSFKREDACIQPDSISASGLGLHFDILKTHSSFCRALNGTPGMAPGLSAHLTSYDSVAGLIENFVFRVAEKLLGTGIPAHDPLGVIHHINRIRRLAELAEPSRSRSQRLPPTRGRESCVPKELTQENTVEREQQLPYQRP